MIFYLHPNPPTPPQNYCKPLKKKCMSYSGQQNMNPFPYPQEN